MKTLIEIDELAREMARRAVSVFRPDIKSNPEVTPRWEVVYIDALSILQQATGRQRCEECERLFEPVTPCDVVCSDCRLDWAKKHVDELVGKIAKGTLPALRADCVDLIPIINGKWQKGCEASPGATHEVWSVESPDYEGEDGLHHGDIRIE